MEKISLEQFIAEIETTFSNYADTNDIDHQSIKTWVIQELRKFGKNICDTSETIVKVKNNRVLLPETFKSLKVAVKVDLLTKEEKENKNKRWVNEKRYISNPAVWDTYTQQYIIDYCETRIVTEKTYLSIEQNDLIYDVELLELEDYVNKDVIDVDCINLHPSIRNIDNNRISINNRTLNTNFKEGEIYLKYNSLPSVDGEIALPVISTGDIYNYIENEVKKRLAESLVVNNKNPTGISQMFQMYAQNSRPMYILAKTESNWHGLKKGWDRKIYKKNLENRIRRGL